MVGTVSQSPLLQNQFLQFDLCLRCQKLTLAFAQFVCCSKVASHDPLLERERLKEIAIARIPVLRQAYSRLELTTAILVTAFQLFVEVTGISRLPPARSIRNLQLSKPRLGCRNQIELDVV